MKISPTSCAALTLTTVCAVALSACDGGNGSGSEPGPAVPPAANTAPTISEVPPRSTVARDASTAPMAFGVSDAESTSSSIAITAESSNPELIPVEGIQLGGNDGARSLLLTPMDDAAGTATITLIATDPQGSSTRQTVDVTVTSETRSFKEMVGTAYGRETEGEGEEIAGHSWVDNPEDDERAFDHLFEE